LWQQKPSILQKFRLAVSGKVGDESVVAKISDLTFAYQVFMKMYPYRRVDWGTGAPLKKPIEEARVALVTTAGLYQADQEPFDESIRGGDYSYREIADDTAVATLRMGQTSDAFDHAGIEADRNLALPLDRLHEMVRERRVGHAAPRHFSFMGSLSAPGRLISKTAPEVAERLRHDRVDAVLLTPV
jgi:D-proline reductase (dithiol) PrdB